jgi:O-antigen ligase
MEEVKRFSPVSFVASLVYSGFFVFFYYKYVPLAKPFQTVLAPLLFILFLLTLWNIRVGITLFVFAFPLINNLPYFFGIYLDIPHAPTALVLFLTFLLGWLFHKSFFSSRLTAGHPLFKPMALISLIILVSGIITLFRYANFYPLLSSGLYELVVNVNGVRAGGALMSVVFTLLNYLTGFLFFFIVGNELKDKKQRENVLLAFFLSISLSLVFALSQRLTSTSLGNMPVWSSMDQINSTFKDPNSFGACLSAALPLSLGLFSILRRPLKPLLLIVIVLGFFIFPFIGSRSSLLALTVGLSLFMVFFLSMIRTPLSKRIWTLAGLVIITVFLLVVFFSQDSILSRRLTSGFDSFSAKTSFESLFTGKLAQWKIALRMLKAFPLTGVGMGGFIIELPNQTQLMGLPPPLIDSAENYFLQVASELGFVGLLLITWLLFELARQTKRAWKTFSSDSQWRMVYVGIVSGMVALATNFLFHSYVGSYEVKYFFWLSVGLILAPLQRGENNSKEAKFSRRFVSASLVTALFFGCSTLWSALHPLSIGNQTRKFGWRQDFGLYDVETDKKGSVFRWMKKRAGITLDNLGPQLVIPLLASNPDLRKNPVKLKIYLADSNFKKKKLTGEISFQENRWIDFVLRTTDSIEEKIHLIFETSRDWRPWETLKIPDSRSLGAGLGAEWFQYPSAMPAERIKRIQSYDSSKWTGEFKENLISTSPSQIRFRVEEKGVALRLWARGQEALNIWPYITVSIDEEIRAKTLVGAGEMTPFIFSPELSTGEHILSVEFENDYCDPKSGQDRNVFLGNLDVIYLR